MDAKRDGRELILFVPGMGSGELEEHLKLLLDGIRMHDASLGYTVEGLDDDRENGPGTRTLEVTSASGQRKLVDVREVHWTDLRPRLTSQKPLSKVVQGLDLLFFWIGSRKLWRAAVHSRYLMFGMISTALLFVVWYYGALVAGITAVGANPAFPGTMQPLLSDGWASKVTQVGAAMGGWYVWVGASALLSAAKVAEWIDISFATKAYAQNRSGFYDAVAGRMTAALDRTYGESGRYDRVSVVAHSFGVVVAVEALAAMERPPPVGTRLLTLGGPLLVLGARSERVEAARLALVQRLSETGFDGWADYYSDHDWLCAPVPSKRDVPGYQSERIGTTVPWDQRGTPESHNVYLKDRDVIGELIAR